MTRSLFALAFAACAAPKPAPHSGEQIVSCHEVYNTGSLFSHTECSHDDDNGMVPVREAGQDIPGGGTAATARTDQSKQRAGSNPRHVPAKP
jgi:hypothetical protein